MWSRLRQKVWSRLWDVPQRKAQLARAGRMGITVVQFTCAWHLFAEYIGGPRMVFGPSMLPTLSLDTELVLEDTLSCRLSPPRIARGDIITLLSPVQPGKTVCKRIIGLPGDTVCVDPSREQRHGYNGVDAQGPWGPAHVVVPTGHVWVAGDNTSASRDSRTYGPVPIALVRGRIFARLYPDPRWFKNPVEDID